MIAMISHASHCANNILLLGDFNLPSISWETGDVGNRFNNGYNTPLHFLGTLQSNGLFQHTTQNTWARGSNAPRPLDIIVTSREDNVEDLKVLAPLGRSDHAVLSCNMLNPVDVGLSRCRCSRQPEMSASENFALLLQENLFCELRS